MPHPAEALAARGEGASQSLPFAVSSRFAFYTSLIKRYWKLFGGMIGLSGLYSGIIGLGRLVFFGVLVEAVELHFRGAGAQPKDLKFLPHLEGGWKWITADAGPTLMHRLREDPDFFMVFLYFAAGLFIAIAVVMSVALFFKDYMAQALIVRMTVDIREALFNHLTRQSVAYFNRQRSGDVISRLTNDVMTVQLSFRFFFEDIVQEPLTILAALIAAYWASPLLFWFVMPLYVILMFPVLRSGKKIYKHGRGRLKKLSLVTEAIQQLFTGIRIVKAFCMESFEEAAFAKKNRAFIRSTMRMSRAKVKGRSLQELFYNVGTASVVLFGVWLLTAQILEISAFGVFLIAMIQLYTPLKSLSRAWNQMQESSSGVERIMEVLHERPLIEDKDGAVDFPRVRDSVRFEKVSFRYDVPAGRTEEMPEDEFASEASGRLPIVRDVSFEVKAGEVLALVGPSGAGKSTIVDLLARFYDPQEGRITVDGRDIREFKRSSYLGAIAIVSQDPFLFNTSIGDNIRYGRVGATDGEVQEAAKVAFAHDFILEQPQGYDTVIGERGVKLSGGQKQRITIARAVLKNAPIIILDEATSALDSHSEKEVQKAMENLMRSRTTFVIAHRLSTIVHADKIIVLEDGSIVEMGNHEDLLARRARYYSLWRSQNPRAEEEVEVA